MFLSYTSLVLVVLWYSVIVCAIVWLMRYLNKRLRLMEEELGLAKQRAVQVDEALTLLRSINENMAHRTTKN